MDKTEEMIAVVDYGMGNLRSVVKALVRVGGSVVLTDDPKTVLRAEKVVLPGVGAFRDCMLNLERKGLSAALVETIQRGTPYLGICLGLQILFTESSEFGTTPGLGIVSGRVVRFPEKMKGDPFLGQTTLKVPHMGWNSVYIKREVPELNGIGDGAYFYFVHSYYVIPQDEGIVATTTHYGIRFVSSIKVNNIFACQFHPEKSQAVGLTLLLNFVRGSIP